MARTSWLDAAPCGLLGAIALAILVEFSIAGRNLDLTNSGLSAWKYSGQAARSEARDAEILCFGDSLVEMGVIPRVLEARTGRRAYNLAAIGAPPTASYFLLKRALDAGARPAAIVIDSKPNILSGRPEWLDRFWTYITTSRDRLDLARTARDAALFATVTLSRHVPSYRDRLPIRSGVLAALRGQDPSARVPGPPLWRNRFINRGAMVMPKNPQVADEVGPGEQDVYYPPSWGADPVSRTYLHRFLTLAASREIPVFWILPPISPKPQARREGLGLDASLTRFVQATAMRHRNVTVVDGRHSGYHAKLFVDQSHLDRQGATTFSHDLGDVIAAHLASKPAGDGPRWVSLPPYRDLSPDVVVEDIDQSRQIATRPGGAVRR